jgi:hypothetical protein
MSPSQASETCASASSATSARLVEYTNAITRCQLRLSQPNSYSRAITMPPIVPVVVSVIPVSRIGPRIRVPVREIRLRVSIRVIRRRVIRFRISIPVRIVRAVIRLWITVRVSSVRVSWPRLIVINHDAAAMWPSYHPSALTHRRYRHDHAQDQRAHRSFDQPGQ